MRKSKKSIVIAVIVGVLLVGTVASVALAQTDSPVTAAGKTLTARVAAILGIDQQKVDDAFTKAKSDMANEALDSQLNALVDSGKMTQQQADQYKGWWQSRPQNVPGIGPGGRMGGHGFMGGLRWPGNLPDKVAPVQ
jgi:hypothetical protein